MTCITNEMGWSGRFPSHDLLNGGPATYTQDNNDNRASKPTQPHYAMGIGKTKQLRQSTMDIYSARFHS